MKEEISAGSDISGECKKYLVGPAVQISASSLFNLSFLQIQCYEKVSPPHPPFWFLLFLLNHIQMFQII